ncbi:MAG: translocation/assembly module TamB domain-containing protein [Pseudomonadota bacterium]
MLRWFMRRIKRFVLLLLLILLLIPVTLWSLASTEGGSRWLINTGLRLLPLELSVQQVEGTLLNSLTLKSVDFNAPPHRGSVKTAHLQWRPAALLKRKLHINLFTVDGLSVDIGETESDAETTEIPQLPLAIDIDRAVLSNSLVTLHGKPHPLEAVELSAHTVDNQLVVESLSLSAEPLEQASLNGNISLLAPHPLKLSLAWEAELAGTGTLKGEGLLQGDLDALSLDHRITAPFSLNTSGKIVPGEAPQIDLRGEWQDLSWPPGDAAEYLSPQGEFTITGSTDDYQVNISAPVNGAALPESVISMTASGDTQGLQLSPLVIELLNGRLTATGDISWSDTPAWDLQIAAEKIEPQRQWPDYAGLLSARAVLKGRISETGPETEMEIRELSGSLRDYDIHGAGKAQWAAGKLKVEQLMLRTGDNRAHLNGVLGEKLDFDFTLDAPQLDQLWPTFDGTLQASGKLRGTPDSPLVEIHGSGAKLELGQYGIDALKADVTWDPADPSRSTTELKLEGVTAAQQRFSKLLLEGPGNLQQHQLKLNIAGSLFNLAMQLDGGYAEKQWSGDLLSSTLQIENAGSWELADAVAITAGPERLEIQKHCWKQQQAELCAAGKWEQHGGIEADGKLTRLPLALLQPLLPPGDKLEGLVSGHFRAGGTQTTPQLDVELDVPTARYLTVADDAQPDIDLRNAKASATLQSNLLKSSFSFDVRANEQGAWGESQGELQLDLSGTTAPLKGRFTLDYPDLSPLLARTPKIRAARGRLQLEADINGTAASPVINGEMHLSDGGFSLPDLNLDVSQISLQAKSDSNGKLQVRGEASTGRGSLLLDGNASLRADEGFPLALNIRGQDVLVSQIPEAEVMISPDLALTGSLKQLDLSGRIDIPLARIELDEVPPTAVDVSADTVIVRKGKKVPRKDQQEVVMALNSNIEVTLGEKVSFKGFGVTTGIRGSLLVSSEAKKPAIGKGRLSLYDGVYMAYGHDLNIERGNFLFDGPVDNPRLDIRAFRTNTFDNVRAGVAITGSLKDIQTKVFTEPEKSETEALSYLLGGGSTFGESSVALGRHLTPRLYVGYLLGLFESSSLLVMRYKLTKKLSLETTSSDEQSVDLYYNIEKEHLFKK